MKTLTSYGKAEEIAKNWDFDPAEENFYDIIDAIHEGINAGIESEYNRILKAIEDGENEF